MVSGTKVTSRPHGRAVAGKYTAANTNGAATSAPAAAPLLDQLDGRIQSAVERVYASNTRLRVLADGLLGSADELGTGGDTLAPSGRVEHLGYTVDVLHNALVETETLIARLERL